MIELYCNSTEFFVQAVPSTMILLDMVEVKNNVTAQ